ncbi:MAG: phage tail tape measure protein [Lachnospiraceae bacterium]|jgi:TP901 family phage tail tape measure protein|nr:phage tail tape measure protein [Lachnospiraceae bacterium]
MANASIRIGASMAEYQRAMKQAAVEMKNLSSEYSLAAANAKLYGTQSDALKAKVTELSQKMDVQRKTVENNEIQTRNLQDRLAETGKKHDELKKNVDSLKDAYNKSRDATGADSEETRKLKEELNKAENQLTQNERQMEKTEAAIEKQKAATTQSKAALAELEVQLRDVNAELARQKFDEYAQKAEKVGGIVSDTGQKMMVVTGAVTGIAGASAKTAADFEAQMSKVQAISGATAEDMEAMSESARYWGSNSKFSASEAASAFEYMALAGWKTEESVSAMEGILNLAAATDMELANASDVVTDYLSAFSMEASQATTVADLMTYAQGNSNTSAEQLAEAYKNCAANANAMGYDIQQTTGMLGIMANQGLKGSEAGTALTAVFRDMTAKMKNGAIAIGDMNIQVVDASGNYRQMTDILKEVEAATNGMGDAEKNAALMSTFTADSVKGLNLLLNAGSGDVSSFTQQLYDCKDSAKDTAAVMQDNLQGQITSLKSKIEGASISIGNLLLPYVKEAVTGISNLVDRFTNLDGGTQKTIVAIGAMVAAAGPLLIGAGKLISFTGSISSGLGIVSAALAKVGFGASGAGASTGAFSTILAAIASPVGVAIAAMAALAAGLGYVAFTNEDIRNSLLEVWRTFTDNLRPIMEYIAGTVVPDLQIAWAGLMKMIQPLADFVKGALTSAWQEVLIPALEWIAGTVLPNVLKTFQNLWENVLRPFGQFVGSVLGPIFSTFAEVLTMLWNTVLLPLANFIMSTVMAAWNGVYTVLNVSVIPIVSRVIEVLQWLWNNALKQVAEWLTASLVPVFQTAFETIGSVIENLKTVFQGVIDFIVGVFTLDLTTAGEGLKGIFTGLWESIKAIFGGALNAIQQVLSIAWEGITTVVSIVWEGISSFFGNIWNTIYTTISTWLDSVWQSVSGIFTSCWEVVQNIWQAIQNVIEVAILFIVELLTAAFELITLPFRFIWENCRETILAVWDTIKETVGTAIEVIRITLETAMEAIRMGLETAWNVISTTVRTVWEAIKNTITTVMDVIKSVIETVWNAIKNGITTAVNGIKSVITTVFNAVKSTVTNIWNGIKTVATTVWNGIKSAVTTPINAAKAAISLAVNGIKSTVSSVFNSVKSTVTSIWNKIKDAITTPINTARDTVKNAIEKIKGFFNFEWSLPHLKLPHPTISGSFSLNPPSVPSFSIDWYKSGGIMTSPTIFGGNGTTLFAGGEAGDEAILPLAPFYTTLSAMLDSKFEALKQSLQIHVTVVNEMDGEVIAEKTTELVADKIVKEYERRR